MFESNKADDATNKIFSYLKEKIISMDEDKIKDLVGKESIKFVLTNESTFNPEYDIDALTFLEFLSSFNEEELGKFIFLFKVYFRNSIYYKENLYEPRRVNDIIYNSDIFRRREIVKLVDLLSEEIYKIGPYSITLHFIISEEAKTLLDTFNIINGTEKKKRGE